MRSACCWHGLAPWSTRPRRLRCDIFNVGIGDLMVLAIADGNMRLSVLFRCFENLVHSQLHYFFYKIASQFCIISPLDLQVKTSELGGEDRGSSMACKDDSEAGARTFGQKNSFTLFGPNYSERRKAHLTQFYLDHGAHISYSGSITKIPDKPSVATMVNLRQSENLVDATNVAFENAIGPSENECVLFKCPLSSNSQMHCNVWP